MNTKNEIMLVDSAFTPSTGDANTTVGGAPLGPCQVCGAVGYPLSYGGPGICPACDCGVSPEVTRLKRAFREAIAQRNAMRDLLREAMEELRLIRMKDTAAVYDPTLRMRITAALAE